MAGFWKGIREFVYRAELYLFGIRFVERDRTDATFVEEYVFEVDAAYQIAFRCYRKTLIDLLFTRGKISTVQYHGYFIEAIPNSLAPAPLQALVNRNIYFNGGVTRFKVDEATLLPLLADIYFDFLKQYMDKHTRLMGEAA